MLHLLILSGGIGQSADYRYPPPLVVDLPSQAPSASAKPAEAEMNLLSRAQDDKRSSSSPQEFSGRVELTPMPEDSTPVIDQPRVYIPAGVLTQKPVLQNPEWLEEIAWKLPSHASGRVVVSLSINKAGQVEAVEVEDGTAPELAEWLVLEIQKHALFTPGVWRDMAVASQLRVQLDLAAISSR